MQLIMQLVKGALALFVLLLFSTSPLYADPWIKFYVNTTGTDPGPFSVTTLAPSSWSDTYDDTVGVGVARELEFGGSSSVTGYTGSITASLSTSQIGVSCKSQ